MKIIEEFPDAPARFGEEIPASGLRVLAIKGVPENGCGTLAPPPTNYTIRHLEWCVVVARYNCSFETKVRYAQAAGYSAVIVHNVGSNEVKSSFFGKKNNEKKKLQILSLNRCPRTMTTVSLFRQFLWESIQDA